MLFNDSGSLGRRRWTRINVFHSKNQKFKLSSHIRTDAFDEPSMIAGYAAEQPSALFSRKKFSRHVVYWHVKRA